MRRRKVNDGLPHRVYERQGLSVYSIGYKSQDNKWVFRLRCDVSDKRRIAQLRKEAVVRVLRFKVEENEIVTIQQLFVAWIARQEKLIAQPKARGSRKKSTLDENKRESKVVCRVFGDMAIVDLEYHHAATYQDTCDEAGRGPKGDKELTLLSVALNFARRRGIIQVNPLVGLEKLPSRPSERYVTSEELDLAVKVGRRMGGSMLITALALQAGYLCVRRSVEVRDLQLQDQCSEGIWWTDGKVEAGATPRRVLIEWSTELRSVIREAIKIRPPTCVGPFIFGTQHGEKYTKGGWKANLARLMQGCIEEASLSNIPFKKFSLMDMRPKAVTDKMASGQRDAVEATLHTSSRMVETVYERLRTRKAKPVK